MKIKIQIVDLSSGDEQEFLSLVKSAYADSPSAFTFIKAPNESDLRALFVRKLELMRSGKLIDIVARLNNQILGECEVAITSSGKVETGIVGIIVRKEFRRKQIGSALLSYAEAKAKSLGIGSFVAEVRIGNAGAAEFFKKCGFKQVASDKEKVTLLRRWS
ncbi:MAG: GNAT family N-acetyltransferase [Candidatus Micrarchaeaceae archaeon]